MTRVSARFRWVKAPTSDELTQLTHTIAQRVARYMERPCAQAIERCLLNQAFKAINRAV